MELVLDVPLDTTSESQAHFNLALEKIHRNCYEDSLVHLRESVRIAPTNPRYLSYYGYCLAQVEEDYDQAARCCRIAVKTSPLDPMLRVNLGRVYRLKGDLAAAHREFLNAHQLNTRHPGPATELTRMGIRRKPVIRFLPRSNWCNKYLGVLRAAIERRTGRGIA